MRKKKKIVVIGGGTGTFTVLSGLKKYPVELAAVVTMADDGGSTGALRDQYGVLPPGDIRRALVALSESSQLLRDLFNYRFRSGSFTGHSFGNIFLTSLHKITGDFGRAVNETAKLLRIKGKVIPVTLNDIRLYARLSDGTILRGETNIDIPKTLVRAPIEETWLKPQAVINPAAKRAILDADMVVVGPGDLYTSLIPNLLVKGVPQALKLSKAKKVYVANIMTKFGETHDFTAEDMLSELERYAGTNLIDFAVFNTRRPSRNVLARYKREKAEFISPKKLSRRKEKPKYVLEDLLHAGKFIRHNPDRLAKILIWIMERMHMHT